MSLAAFAGGVGVMLLLGHRDSGEPLKSAEVEVLKDREGAAGTTLTANLNPNRPQAPRPKGRLEVIATDSVAEHATIVIQSLEPGGETVKGETPRYEGWLPAGAYEVRVELAPNRGCKPVVVEVGADAQQVIELECVYPIVCAPQPELGDCKPDEESAPGRLSIDTTPPTTLFYGACRLGRTPIKSALLPAGCVRLLAIDKDHGIATYENVQIEPNKSLEHHFEVGAPR